MSHYQPGKQQPKSALLVSLLNVVLPNPAIFVVERFKTQKKSYTDIQIQFTATQLVFKRSYVDYQRVVAIFVKSQQEVQVHCREGDHSEREVLEIRSGIVSQLYNELHYRVSVCQTWTRRLRSGIVKEALLDREMLILLNKSSPLFGQLTPTQISEITERIRRNGYFFSNSITYKTIPVASKRHSRFFEEHEQIYASKRRSGAQASLLADDEGSELSVSALSSFAPLVPLAPQSTMSNMADSILGMSQRRQSNEFADVMNQRRQLEFLTGACEPIRVKIAVDQIQLNTHFRQIQSVQDAFLRQKFENADEACRLVKLLLQGLQQVVMQTSQIKRQQTAGATSDFLQSTSVADIAEIAVERMACSLIFPRLWACVKAECAAQDQRFYGCCNALMSPAFLEMRNLDHTKYDALQAYLGIPEELRDFCGFNLVISEIQQLDSALNMHPRNFTRILLETNAALQLTVNLNTEKGRTARIDRKTHAERELVTIGQDEQLPIMIYVVAAAKLRNAVTILTIMENASFDSILQDEEGFMINQFACCVQWVVDEVNGRHTDQSRPTTPAPREKAQETPQSQNTQEKPQSAKEGGDKKKQTVHFEDDVQSEHDITRIGEVEVVEEGFAISATEESKSE